MKNMVKKNQIMITALAIMIAVAGYLNFAGSRITEEEIMTAGSDTVVAGEQVVTGTDEDVAALFEISDEDIEQADTSEIQSLDSEVVISQDNYLDESMDEIMAENMSGEVAQNIGSELSGDETPGEAVFTSASSLDTLSGARLMKEQTRARNKETLLEIINNVNISEEQKQAAVDDMIAITDVAEKETAAEILLESKGFDDVVVSITDDTVDVVVNAQELTEAQRAQIEDIIIRKTGVSPEAIVISTLNAQ
ncbi:SpoIIIAH-like family protein [Parablautia intestinalis]|uniref:SpoIIIAH-like family protein n=2 Tax=Parablautia intestinalis TaxID=2320100 RepID=A0A3A9B282_9FIRM|nr:SpoIIIAH-like family protein [Lachnospiraceae bacterium]RKI93576.1 SpoIIIAH-like family protein [Parablautia intestinalis]